MILSQSVWRCVRGPRGNSFISTCKVLVSEFSHFPWTCYGQCTAMLQSSREWVCQSLAITEELGFCSQMEDSPGTSLPLGLRGSRTPVSPLSTHMQHAGEKKKRYLKVTFSRAFHSVSFFGLLSFCFLWMNFLHFSLPSICKEASPCTYAQSCLTLCDPTDCSLLGSSVHEIFQTGILEWVAISSSRVAHPGFKPKSLVPPNEAENRTCFESGWLSIPTPPSPPAFDPPWHHHFSKLGPLPKVLVDREPSRLFSVQRLGKKRSPSSLPLLS